MKTKSFYNPRINFGLNNKKMAKPHFLLEYVLRVFYNNIRKSKIVKINYRMKGVDTYGQDE